MATIFYKTGGNFSALTPQKTTYSNIAVTYVASGYTAYDLLNPVFNVAFTPSDAGDVEGVYCQIALEAMSATNTVTVTLQEYVASVWTNRVSKSLTYNEIGGSFSSSVNNGLHSNWVYFQFASPYTVDTSAGKWRISFLSSTNKAGLGRSTGGNSLAVVLTATTSYSASDNILTKHNITVTVDQSITATSYICGVDSKLEWATSPASSYTLTITNLYLSPGFQFNVGTSTNRIPYAQKAIVSITNVYGVLIWGYGDMPWALTMYGELPTSFKTTIASNAASGQKNIVTTDNMSSTWQAGDTITVNAAGNPIQYTIASVSGTTVTTTTNLSVTAQAGYSVLNVTRYRMCGTSFGTTFIIGSNHGNLWRFKLSGVYSAYSITVTFFYQSFDYNTAGTLSIIEPVLAEYVTGEAALSIQDPTSYAYNQNGVAKHANSIIRHRYSFSAGTSNQLYVTSLVSYTISDIYVGGYLNTAYFNLVSSTIADMECLNNWSSYSYTYYSAYIGGTDNTITNAKINGVSVTLLGVKHTFSSCWFDSMTSTSHAIHIPGTVIDCVFNNCTFGGKIANGASFGFSTGVYATVICNNCVLDSVPIRTTYADLTTGSYIKFATYGATANDHRSWWKYGKMVSTGDGLTDTTVHTSGTGKFAIRFEPTSSTNNLTWDFSVPTGNIQTKTMTVGVWCKINSATYYAGTHQLPRLTIDYDNGTTAYHQAGETTDWQLLFVSFTPTTTYGQITVTLSGRTDATTTNAYIYWDDFTVAYPPSVALDLGGMDNWANALPVTPPIALPISAGTVAQNVWQQLTTTSWGTNSMGEEVKAVPGEIKYIVGGKLPLY